MQNVQLMSVEAITKAIAGITKSAAKVRTDIQTIAVQAVAHSIVHKNTDIATALFNGVTDTVRRDALSRYLEVYGCLAWMKDEKRFAYFAATTKDNVTGEIKPLEWTPEYAMKVSNTLWTTAKKEPTIKSVYDVEEEFRKFVDRITKVSKVAGTQVKHEDLLNKLNTVFVQYVSAEAVKNSKAEEPANS